MMWCFWMNSSDVIQQWDAGVFENMVFTCQTMNYITNFGKSRDAIWCVNHYLVGLKSFIESLNTCFDFIFNVSIEPLKICSYPHWTHWDVVWHPVITLICKLASGGMMEHLLIWHPGTDALWVQLVGQAWGVMLARFLWLNFHPGLSNCARDKADITQNMFWLFNYWYM